MSKIIERIGEYASKTNRSIRSLEEQIGAGNGTFSKAISKGTDVKTIWLSKFIDVFTDVNPIWLLKGEGEMLVPDEKPILKKKQHIENVAESVAQSVANEKLKKSNTVKPCPKCELNEEKLSYQTELISMLREKVSDKEEIISHLKDMLEMIQKGPDKGKNGHHSSQAS